jgi:hypothetical protein
MQITFLCRTESYERQFFDDWMEIINPTNLWDFNYRDQYRANIDIFQLAEAPNSTNGTAPKAVYKWTLWDAYPTTINPQPVSWADDNIQRLSVSFTYSHWTRVNRDTTPGNFMNDFIQGKTVIGLPGLTNATLPQAPGSQSGSGGGGSVGGPGSGGGGGGNVAYFESTDASGVINSEIAVPNDGAAYFACTKPYALTNNNIFYYGCGGGDGGAGQASVYSLDLNTSKARQLLVCTSVSNSSADNPVGTSTVECK